jgi:thiamine biosynthesis protein ThiS
MVRLFFLYGNVEPEMEIWVNGVRKEFSDRLTVSGLLEQLAIQGEQVAVELNLAVLERADFAKTVLKDGDKLEIIRFVGGGLGNG